MTQKIVYTKKELKEAKNQKVDKIIVKGKLANKLHKGLKVAKAGNGVIDKITNVFGSSPTKGNISTGAVAPIAVLTGIEIALIIAALSVGIGLIMAISKDYDEVKYKDKNRELVLEREKN